MTFFYHVSQLIYLFIQETKGTYSDDTNIPTSCLHFIIDYKGTDEGVIFLLFPCKAMAWKYTRGNKIMTLLVSSEIYKII